MQRVPVHAAGQIIHANRELVAAYTSLGRMRKLHMEVSSNGELAGVKDLLGTAFANGERSVRFEDRLTRCNELTNFALVFGEAPDACRLIHGSMHGRFEGNQRIAHSWLILRTVHADLVWEPATALWHMKDEWYKYARAWDEREYTKAQATQLTRATEHYGPWHESRYP
jgi:hypothetical protein